LEKACGEPTLPKSAFDLARFFSRGSTAAKINLAVVWGIVASRILDHFRCDGSRA
jgi:hypothetical protein